MGPCRTEGRSTTRRRRGRAVSRGQPGGSQEGERASQGTGTAEKHAAGHGEGIVLERLLCGSAGGLCFPQTLVRVLVGHKMFSFALGRFST